MASTYVQISRDQLETWLSSLYKWERVQGKAGIYHIILSDTVAVRLSSTIGTRDDAMDRGKASMKLALVSRVTGRTLNKKAMGQSYFKRTTNWERTWAGGVQKMKDAYLKSAGFYDALAEIEDRDKYKADLLAHIESRADWNNDRTLADFHSRVENGSILTHKQKGLLERLVSRGGQGGGGAAPAPAADDQADIDEKMVELRKLYVAAKRAGDRWTYEQFLDPRGNVIQRVKRGQPLSQRQKEILFDKFDRYESDMKRVRLATVESVTQRYLRKVMAKEFTPEQWKTHKQEHPGAERADHTIAEPKGKGKGKGKGKKPEKAKPGKVQPQDSPEGAYKEVKRIQTWEFDKGKMNYGPSSRSTQPGEVARRKKIQKTRRGLADELESVLRGGGKPNPKKVKSLLTTLKGELYPLGGRLAPGGRRLNQLIKMVDSISGGGKKASDILAVYRLVERAVDRLAAS